VQLTGFDHLVLCVRDVGATIAFYERVLGMAAREERPGKWSLHAGPHKISLQDAVASPSIAAETLPGSGNFCVLSATPMDEVVARLTSEGIEIVDGPGERAGAQGPLLSVYIHDPDGNLVEIANQL
jgi:catechol 2,3-dioxygenase-like lactoylglutathione lyase family enzyme